MQSDLSDKLGPLWAQEEQSLLGYKQKLCEEMGEEFDNKINMWDLNVSESDRLVRGRES